MAEFEDNQSRGVTVRDVDAAAFIAAYAAHLKRSNEMELPANWDFMKTAPHKEYSPFDPDWYYIRAASIARKVYLRRSTGVGALQKVYGSKKRRGTRTNHFAVASGGVIRHILHNLENSNVLEADEKGGRRISRVGQQHLDRIATAVYRGQA
eukprot:CAMPEP_0182464006 /NCGR_PEP_ID=MMETSP1319-20130603/8169_1 /TAXON_ID=172717 /ORGANISM="Bolidomonas pacifica, Strain RCC208" /LENGTH=151 /DNA_ID=CAMNT_0024663607 /DNA_START=8 /DNA_END=463 /DNA_ORIENTATION=-